MCISESENSLNNEHLLCSRIYLVLHFRDQVLFRSMFFYEEGNVAFRIIFPCPYYYFLDVFVRNICVSCSPTAISASNSTLDTDPPCRFWTGNTSKFQFSFSKRENTATNLQFWILRRGKCRISRTFVSLQARTMIKKDLVALGDRTRIL